jgi:hypothetical protein
MQMQIRSGRKYVVIQTFLNKGENSRSKIRAAAVAGQGWSTALRVECSKEMRKETPIGSYILLEAQMSQNKGTPIIYSHYSWQYEVITKEEAFDFIKNHGGSNHP